MPAEFSAAEPLAGLTAVVTGSTSGIGRALAVTFARAGADVVVHGRSRREAAEETAEEIRALGRRAHVVLADLAQATSHAYLAEEAWNWRQGVDVWVNNAGADVLTPPACDWLFEEKLQHLWRVDVLGAIGLCRLIGPRMKDRGAGAIVNIGWDQAEHGMAGDSGEMFAAIKGAVMAFTRSLAASLAPQVRVNCLAPGWIKTAWGEEASEYWQQRAADESLLARWGTPRDVAQAALFLVSPAASFLTGLVLPVNGGFRRS